MLNWDLPAVSAACELSDMTGHERYRMAARNYIDFILSECVAGNGICTFGDTCPMRPVWCDAQAELVERLKTTTFDNFLGTGPLPTAA